MFLLCEKPSDPLPFDEWQRVGQAAGDDEVVAGGGRVLNLANLGDVPNVTVSEGVEPMSIVQGPYDTEVAGLHGKGWELELGRLQEFLDRNARGDK